MAEFIVRKPFKQGGVWKKRGEVIDLTGFDSRTIAKLMEQDLVDVSQAAPEAPPPAATPFKFNADSTAVIPEDNADSFIVGSDRMDQDNDTTKNARAFFSKAKAAFRAGSMAGTQWNAGLLGYASHAEGSNTQADGNSSHAEGSNTTASHTGAHAEGVNSKATGYASHAEGYNNTASGESSHAEGLGTTASGARTHAEGQDTVASGFASHAEGLGSIASGAYSHAEGQSTTASGAYSHAEGVGSQATRDFAHAGGQSCYAEGWGSVATGYRARAIAMLQRARASYFFGSHGDAQVSDYVLMGSTTDATPKVLTSMGSAVTSSGMWLNVHALPPGRVHKFRVDVGARRTDVAGEAAGWEFSGVVARDATGNPYLVGTIDSRVWNTTNAAAWTVAVSIDTADAANPFLAVTATGEAAKTIRWVADLEVVEVG